MLRLKMWQKRGRWLFLIFLHLVVLNKGHGVCFASPYNHRSEEEIREFKICGERCSGTNFVTHLMIKNFPDLERVGSKFGHKHFLWWFDTPIDEDKLKLLKFGEEAVTFADSDHCLFIVVVRNVYDWVRSFYENPHHVSKHLRGKGFFFFMSRPWHSEEIPYPPGEGLYKCIDDFHPTTGEPFKNVFELRKCKLENYLKLGERVNHFCLVRYEDVSESPEEFIDFMARSYYLKRAKRFVPVSSYKGEKSRLYRKKKYFRLRFLFMQHINSSVDWKIENKIGYSVQEYVQ